MMEAAPAPTGLPSPSPIEPYAPVRPEAREHVEQLFEAALALPTGERPAFVSDAAGDNIRLAREVMALLRAHERADGLLERTPPRPPPPRSPGDRIGAYRIIGELGRGGMGVVYAAERDDGTFQRRVAIKVLRGDADPALEVRVVAERQILASLDHPSIARLFDGGITPDGRPFLVMEHVDGLPIDVYADRMRLSIDERLELFITVTEAVQHAHRNLVVHRDLKPSNILVTARSDVKLLDFGIAKLLNPALAPAGVPMTLDEHRALTPEYASPEQVSGAPLSTATDVYSLGVVLYRLLSGRPPYRFGKDSMATIVEVISRNEPSRPSEAIRGADPGEALEAAEARGTTPERLARRLEGDLDAIVLRALRKEPSQRYGSAELLAHDLRRHLEGEPVEARRGARGYRVRTFVRRHRVGIGAAAAMLVSLLAGAGAALWQARVASHERDRAAEALRQSEEVTGFLMSLFTVSDPTDTRLDEVTAGDLLRRGLLRVERLGSQPLIQGRMLEVVADVHLQLGQYEQAVELHRRALAILAGELGPEDPEVARAMNGLGVALRNVAGYEEARSLHREALRIQRARLSPNDTSTATTLGHLAYIEADLARRAALQEEMVGIRLASQDRDAVQIVGDLMALANTERGLGHYDDAVALLRRAREIGRTELGADDPRAATPLLHIGDIFRAHLGRSEEAEQLYREALAIQEAALGPYDLILIHGLHSLGDLLGIQGRHREAEATLQRAIEILSRALGTEHPRTVGSRLNLAAELSRQGRNREAEELYRSVIDTWERTRGPGHPSVAVARAALARVLAQMDRLGDAEREVRTALEIWNTAHGPRSLMTGLNLTQLGDVLRQRERTDRARSVYEEARMILLEHLDPDHPQVRDVDRRLVELELAEIEGPSTQGPIF